MVLKIIGCTLPSNNNGKYSLDFFYHLFFLIIDLSYRGQYFVQATQLNYENVQNITSPQINTYVRQFSWKHCHIGVIKHSRLRNCCRQHVVSQRSIHPNPVQELILQFIILKRIYCFIRLLCGMIMANINELLLSSMFEFRTIVADFISLSVHRLHR